MQALSDNPLFFNHVKLEGTRQVQVNALHPKPLGSLIRMLLSFLGVIWSFWTSQMHKLVGSSTAVPLGNTMERGWSFETVVQHSFDVGLFPTFFRKDPGRVYVVGTSYAVVSSFFEIRMMEVTVQSQE